MNGCTEKNQFPIVWWWICYVLFSKGLEIRVLVQGKHGTMDSMKDHEILLSFCQEARTGWWLDLLHLDSLCTEQRSLLPWLESFNLIKHYEKSLGFFLLASECSLLNSVGGKN